jgi:hypothetical protein
MKTKLLLILSLSLTIICSNSFAQPESKSFAELLDARPTVEINLGATMLGLLSSASKNEEEGIAKILSALEAINVTVFEIENSSKIDSIRDKLNNLADMKAKSGYEKLASIREDDSLVYIFANIANDKLNSLSITALDDDEELVLIEIKGELDMSDIGDLMDHFDVDVNLDSLGSYKHSKKEKDSEE